MLIKNLEEPNDNIYFILINNNKKILPHLNLDVSTTRFTLHLVNLLILQTKFLGENFMDLINDQLLIIIAHQDQY